MLNLWACPLGLHQYEASDNFNPLIARVLQSIRVLDVQTKASTSFYASKDDLLHRIRIPEWQSWLEFLIDSIAKTARHANAGIWPETSEDLTVEIVGLWCQFSNLGVHHDVHSHGNCSWSGVYIVQVDPDAQRQMHEVYKESNGVTRFYGPHFQNLAGAAIDYGNAYLQSAHLDISPYEGRLAVFPSWLLHQAMPYQGLKDRIILSFNASIHRKGGDRWADYAHS